MSLISDDPASYIPYQLKHPLIRAREICHRRGIPAGEAPLGQLLARARRAPTSRPAPGTFPAHLHGREYSPAELEEALRDWDTGKAYGIGYEPIRLALHAGLKKGYHLYKPCGVSIPRDAMVSETQAQRVGQAIQVAWHRTYAYGTGPGGNFQRFVRWHELLDALEPPEGFRWAVDSVDGPYLTGHGWHVLVSAEEIAATIRYADNRYLLGNLV